MTSTTATSTGASAWRRRRTPCRSAPRRMTAGTPAASRSTISTYRRMSSYVSMNRSAEIGATSRPILSVIDCTCGGGVPPGAQLEGAEQGLDHAGGGGSCRWSRWMWMEGHERLRLSPSTSISAAILVTDGSSLNLPQRVASSVSTALQRRDPPPGPRGARGRRPPGTALGAQQCGCRLDDGEVWGRRVALASMISSKESRGSEARGWSFSPGLSLTGPSLRVSDGGAAEVLCPPCGVRPALAHRAYAAEPHIDQPRASCT